MHHSLYKQKGDAILKDHCIYLTCSGQSKSCHLYGSALYVDNSIRKIEIWNVPLFHVYKTLCRRAEIFYLSQPGVKPRSLELQANTLPLRCKSRLLPQGSRSVFIYTLTLWHTPPPIWNSSLNFLVQESSEMRPREIFMRRTVIGWVIYGGRHCGRAKIFYLPQLGIEPGSLDLQANTLPCRCKSRLLPQGSRRVFIYT